MANAIQKFAANTACCLATNIKKTDDKLKYGSEDMICCINKDFMANVFSELLMCNTVAIDNTWYKLSICLSFIDRTPPEYTYGTDVIFTSAGYLISNDGNRQIIVNFDGEYNFANIEEVELTVTDIINAAANNNGDPSIILTASYNTTAEYIEIVIYHDGSWGDIDNPLSYGSLTSTIPFTAIIESSSHDLVSSIVTDSCFTTTELCEIKAFLDKYCQSC